MVVTLAATVIVVVALLRLCCGLLNSITWNWSPRGLGGQKKKNNYPIRTPILLQMEVTVMIAVHIPWIGQRVPFWILRMGMRLLHPISWTLMEDIHLISQPRSK